MGQFIRDNYDVESGVHDGLACDIVTEMLDIPGVKEAVLIDALHNSHMSMKYDGLECIEDIPFQHAWTKVFNKEE